MAFVSKTQKDEAVREEVAKGNYQLVYMSLEAVLYIESQMERNVSF